MALVSSERINLIQSAAKTLAEVPRIDAELALDMFEVRDLEFSWASWESHAYSYLVERLKAASDEALLALNAHLVGDASLAPGAGSWKEGHVRVFLSHTSANRKLGGEVREILLREGIDLFVAHDVIETDKEWIEEIKVGLVTCEVLVALFTPDFRGSQWCDQEVGHALGRGIRVISIKHAADPHGFVFPKQAFEVSPDDPHAAVKIGKEICRHVKGEEPTSIPDPAFVAVRQYARSRSFDQARQNLQPLLKLKASDWTPQMVELVETAGRENFQVAEAYWYEERVPEVLAEHLADLGVLPSKPPPPDNPPPAAAEPDIPF
jgi:TIR domain